MKTVAVAPVQQGDNETMDYSGVGGMHLSSVFYDPSIPEHMDPFFGGPLWRGAARYAIPRPDSGPIAGSLVLTAAPYDDLLDAFEIGVSVVNDPAPAPWGIDFSASGPYSRLTTPLGPHRGRPLDAPFAGSVGPPAQAPTFELARIVRTGSPSASAETFDVEITEEALVPLRALLAHPDYAGALHLGFDTDAGGLVSLLVSEAVVLRLTLLGPLVRTDSILPLVRGTAPPRQTTERRQR